MRRGLSGAAGAAGGVSAGDAAAAAGVRRGWPVRARGAGGWCGAAFCVHRNDGPVSYPTRCIL